MMSAPSAIMRRACASALSGAMKAPPSEKESGVMLSTPITAGQGRASSAGRSRRPAGEVALADLDVVAIMRSLCAVRSGVSRSGRGQKPAQAAVLICDLGRQLLRLLDQPLHRFLRRHRAHELAL